MGKRTVKRPAVFIDRDGTLILQRDDIVRFSQVQTIKGVPEALRLLKELGFLLIVITNQPVISKGLITQAGVRKLNASLKGRLGKRGGPIDDFYICPHRSWDGCQCRKPNLGLVRQAVKKYHIDLKHSFFVGDHRRDIETGRRANMKTVLVRTGNAGKDKKIFDAKPDFTAKDLWATANLIKRIIT